MGAAPEITDKRFINHRPTFASAIGPITGILVFGRLTGLGAAVFAAAAVAAAAFLITGNTGKSFPGAPILLISAAIGVLITLLATPRIFQAGNYTACGIVADRWQQGGKTVLLLKRPQLNGTDIDSWLMLTVGGETDAAIGDRVTAEVYARPLTRSYGEHDEYTSRLSAGIGAVASAESAAVTARHCAPIAEAAAAANSVIEARIKSVFGSDGELFSALILGNRREVDDERIAVFRASGTAHLLAISGFHMGITAGAAALLIPKNKRLLRLILVSILMLVYCTVASYAPGFVRAAIMMFCILLASCLDRRPDMLCSLSLAAVLILLVNPYQIYSAGFRLSFSACFGIALFGDTVQRAASEHKRAGKLLAALGISAAAVIGTLPFQLCYFNSLATYTLPANLAAIPAFTVVIVSGIIVTGVSFVFPGAAAALAVVPRGVLFVIERLLKFMGSLPFSSIGCVTLPPMCCALWLLGLFITSEYVLLPLKRRLPAALCVFAACAILIVLSSKSVI